MVLSEEELQNLLETDPNTRPSRKQNQNAPQPTNWLTRPLAPGESSTHHRDESQDEPVKPRKKRRTQAQIARDQQSEVGATMDKVMSMFNGLKDQLVDTRRELAEARMPPSTAPAMFSGPAHQTFNEPPPSNQQAFFEQQHQFPQSSMLPPPTPQMSMNMAHGQPGRPQHHSFQTFGGQPGYHGSQTGQPQWQQQQQSSQQWQQQSGSHQQQQQYWR
ncbi:hypothetical protein K3495_g6624 [Podosphaera aphanis]|nr:hypothetical protein K3495_g6624 [Podosphaera aphanis]